MTREETMTAKPKPDPAAFAETPRDPAKLADVETAIRQFFRYPAMPVAKSENQ